MRALDELREIGPRRVLTASVTPLASIFGGGFLIIVPVLERTLGGLAVVGAIGVSGVAWVIGTAIRHNIKAIEPLAAKNELGEGNERLERLSDIVIAVAYVVSVALYLRIMAEYLVDYVAPGSSTATSVVAAAAMAIIVLVGVTRGFAGLDLTERIALASVLVITTVLGAAYLFESGGRLLGGGIDLPPVPDAGIGTTLLMLGGIGDHRAGIRDGSIPRGRVRRPDPNLGVAHSAGDRRHDLCRVHDRGDSGDGAGHPPMGRIRR